MKAQTGQVFEAVLFDLDGVLTPTVDAHKWAWAQLFTAVLPQWPGVLAYTDRDYALLLDGRPRYEGVTAVLASRGIDLPYGQPSDGPEQLTVCGLGNRKDALFRAQLAHGLLPYPGSLRCLDEVMAAGLSVAVVSGSQNAAAVLAAAGLASRFAVVVDGMVAAARGLPGKPAPDTYLEAAHRLGAAPARAIVVEDAVSGVQAGRAGGFGLVVGVDRGAGHQALSEAGANLVVDDLGQLGPKWWEVSE